MTRPGPLAPVLAAALCLQGCAAGLADLHATTTLHSDLGEFELRSTGQDPADTSRVSWALLQATPGPRHWGTLQRRVTVYLLPDHDALEFAVRRPGYDWLRAWGRYDELLLQAPRTWPGGGATEAQLAELLVHELTHCVMYQRAGDADTWVQRAIPLWFREGMASWTAQQGYRWPSLEDLSREYNTEPSLDPFGNGEALSKRHERLVYGSAHHAFTFLVRRYGPGSVEQVLDAMKGGLVFSDAFEQALGLAARDFTAEFSRYVRWAGYRRDALPHRPHRDRHRAEPATPP